MKKVVIGFSDNPKNRWWGRLIKWYLKTDFYHTYLYFPEENIVWESTIKGVKSSTREKWVSHNTIISEYNVEVDLNRFQEILKFVEDREGTPYGFGQYVAILFNLRKDNGLKRTICSEFVARGMNKELGIVGELDKIDPKEVWEVASKKFPLRKKGLRA